MEKHHLNLDSHVSLLHQRAVELPMICPLSYSDVFFINELTNGFKLKNDAGKKLVYELMVLLINP